MLKVLSGFFNLYLVLVWIVSGLIHLWTVYIAYSIGGLFWGVVSFFFPVISQIYWGFEAFRYCWS
jgi:TM2 domain-containing membrane protein YozV